VPVSGKWITAGVWVKAKGNGYLVTLTQHIRTTECIFVETEWGGILKALAAAFAVCGETRLPMRGRRGSVASRGDRPFILCTQQFQLPLNLPNNKQRHTLSSSRR
jgi:hypothetical protein